MKKNARRCCGFKKTLYICTRKTGITFFKVGCRHGLGADGLKGSARFHGRLFLENENFFTKNFADSKKRFTFALRFTKIWFFDLLVYKRETEM
jgi:hypothetical protein